MSEHPKLRIVEKLPAEDHENLVGKIIGLKRDLKGERERRRVAEQLAEDEMLKRAVAEKELSVMRVALSAVFADVQKKNGA